MTKRLKPSEEINRYISLLSSEIDQLVELTYYGSSDPIDRLLGEIAGWLKYDLRMITLKLYGYKSLALNNFWRGDNTLDQLLNYIKRSPSEIKSIEEVIDGLQHLERVAERSEKHYRNEETIDKQVFTYKGFRVEALNLSKETTSAMLQAIDCLEEIFEKRGVEPLVYKAIDKVYLQHNPSNQVGQGWGKSHASYEKKKVYLYDTILDLDKEMPEIETICYVLIHEIGHWVHHEYLPREAHVLWNSSWDGVMRGRKEIPPEEAQISKTLQGLEIPTQYGHKNPFEDFAETFTRFMVDPNSISEVAKNRLKATLSLSAGFGRRFMKIGSRIERLMERVAKLENEEKQSKAEDYFFDNPLAKSVREFAESNALSNDPDTSKKSIENSENPDRSRNKAKKESILAPPPPTEIKEKPGGKEFSTLNQLVVDTEEKVKGVPKGFDEAPKVDPEEVIPEAKKSNKQLKKEVVQKVMRRKGYVIS